MVCCGAKGREYGQEIGACRDMMIDAHIHITPDGRWYNTDYDASVETALGEMDKAGVEMAAVIAMPGKLQREYMLKVVKQWPDRFVTGFTISGLGENEFRELSDWLDGPAKFVKVHPRQTGISPLDRGLDRFLEAAEKSNIPVIFDTYPRGLKGRLEDLNPCCYDELAHRHPDLKIVLAHAGAHRVLDALAVAQTHPNVYLELSHVLAYFQGTSLIRDFTFIMGKMDQKLIYGSDFPEYPIDRYIGLARELISSAPGSDPESFFAGNWLRIMSSPGTAETSAPA